MVDLSDHVLVDVQWGKREKPDEKFKRKCEVKRNISLVVVLMVAIPAQIFSIVSDSFPKLLGVEFL